MRKTERTLKSISNMLLFNVQKKILVKRLNLENIASTLQREVTLQVIVTGKRFDVGPRSRITTGKSRALRR